MNATTFFFLKKKLLTGTKVNRDLNLYYGQFEPLRFNINVLSVRLI